MQINGRMQPAPKKEHAGFPDGPALPRRTSRDRLDPVELQIDRSDRIEILRMVPGR